MKEIFFAIFKLIIFFLILPLLIATIIVFQSQIVKLPPNKEMWFLWGAGSYLVSFLFIYDFKAVHELGKSSIEKIVAFFKPLAYIFPIYTLVLIFAYIIAVIFGRGVLLMPYVFFAIAFSISMHTILIAQELYASDKSVFKAHYLLSFGTILILTIIIASLLLAWIVPEYNLLSFIKSLGSQTVYTYKFIYKFIFIDSTF